MFASWHPTGYNLGGGSVLDVVVQPSQTSFPCTRLSEECTHVKDHDVHVRIRWVTETRKDPAYIVRHGYRCSCGFCSLTQVRRPEFPERDNKMYTKVTNK